MTLAVVAGVLAAACVALYVRRRRAHTANMEKRLHLAGHEAERAAIARQLEEKMARKRLKQPHRPTLATGTVTSNDDDVDDAPPGIRLAVKARQATMTSRYSTDSVPVRYLPTIKPQFAAHKDDHGLGRHQKRRRRRHHEGTSTGASSSSAGAVNPSSVALGFGPKR